LCLVFKENLCLLDFFNMFLFIFFFRLLAGLGFHVINWYEYFVPDQRCLLWRECTQKAAAAQQVGTGLSRR